MEPILFLSSPNIDSRGYLVETMRSSKFDFIPAQENVCFSYKNVLRGLHYQIEPKQSKLLYVLHGKILDVCINIHTGKIYEFILEPFVTLYIPDNFLHGYSILSDSALVCYKMDGEYNPEKCLVVSPIDNTLNINWRVDPILSDKDKNGLSFVEFLKIIKELNL